MDGENLHETRDLLLKLEVDENVEDDNDDTQSGINDTSPNEDVSTNEDKKVNR